MEANGEKLAFIDAIEHILLYNLARRYEECL
jgi:hypothetical protein